MTLSIQSILTYFEGSFNHQRSDKIKYVGLVRSSRTHICVKYFFIPKPHKFPLKYTAYVWHNIMYCTHPKPLSFNKHISIRAVLFISLMLKYFWMQMNMMLSFTLSLTCDKHCGPLYIMSSIGPNVSDIQWWFFPRWLKLQFPIAICRVGRCLHHVKRSLSMGQCKKDVTPLLTHWSSVFLALTHRYIVHPVIRSIFHSMLSFVVVRYSWTC